MASLISGYEYDIFISYRQKDNKGDMWISEFVEALKVELESTFKEDISIYFDINPHDGLLETHDVDASLKDKLKCLIFIPIISQTYCDSKSFAWQHEFVAFNKIAKEDQFGRDIKLVGGNVASRILPVKINDLDPDDKTLLENEIGGVLRSIEFIYKSAGVNRPLRANEDHPQDNLNKTYYRDQINKVANAVKEIITALRKHDQNEGEVRKDIVITRPEAPKNPITKIIIASSLVLILILLGYFLIPKLARPKEQLEKSIAVLPFRNDSSSDSTTYFINGLMEEILNNLQRIKNFRVLSRTSTEQFRGDTKTSIPEIAKKLDVNYVVEGSGQKYGNKFVLRVQLLAGDKEKHIWGESFDQEIHDVSDIIKVQSQIAQSIALELKAAMSPEAKRLISQKSTPNLTAYDFCLRGNEEFRKLDFLKPTFKKSAKATRDLFEKALVYDSTYGEAYLGLAKIYFSIHYLKDFLSKDRMDSALILVNKALLFNDKLDEAYALKGDCLEEKGLKDQAVREYEKALRINPNCWQAYSSLGDYYSKTGDYVQIIDNYQHAASLNHGPERPGILSTLAMIYSSTGFQERAEYYNLNAFKLSGDSVMYFTYLGMFEYFQANYDKSREYCEKILSVDSTNLVANIFLGLIYSLDGHFAKSIELLKKSLAIFKTNGMDYPGIGISLYIGYDYWKIGNRKESEFYFEQEIENCKNRINSGRFSDYELSFTHLTYVGIYAIRGEKSKAYNELKIYVKNQNFNLGNVNSIKNDPSFNNLRNEPEFKQIVTDIEAKYQAEHERVRKWLEEQGKL